MTTLKAIEQISSTLTPSSQISASLVSDNNISASITTGVVINQISGDVTPGISAPGGSNTQIQFNDSGILGGASAVTYNKTTSTLSAATINATQVNASFAGNGSNITNISYANITGKPVLSDVATSGDYADLNGTPVLSDVATSGDYADLNGTPVLSDVATSGSYLDLTNRPALAPVATSGLYGDLTGKPVLGTAALVDSSVFATAAQGIKADSALQSITSTNSSIAITTNGTARDLSVLYSNQARTLISTCRNNSGTLMTAGTVVYISTAQGSQPVITRAQANAESTSTKTYGIVASTIADNASGTVIVAGELTGVNTDGLATGAVLWLSPTVAGGFTTTKPSAPNHAVVVGTVVYAHQNNGIIEVRVVNGYELEELHNVSLNGTIDNQVLTYEASTQLWKAKSPVSAVSQLTNDANYVNTTQLSTKQDLDADLTAIAALSGTSGLLRKSGINTWVLDTSVFLTSINSTQIINALGYTPYSAANPNAYITAADTIARALVANSADSVTWSNVSGKPSFATVATSGSYNDLSNKPTALSQFANDSGFITTTTANTNYQPKDSDLTTLAALADNGFVKRVAGSYVIDSTSVYLTGITSGQVTTALGYTPINPTEKGAINGVASLDGTGNVPLAQLPDSLENVVTVGTYSLLPVTGVADRIYIVDDTNLIYRWDSGVYKSITASVANTDSVPEGATNKYFTTARARSSINVSGNLTYDSVNGTVGYVAPTLATVATTGLYSSLTGQPTQLSQFTNNTNFTTLAAVAAAYQPLDSDLTTLAGLSTNGIARRSAGVWTIDSSNYLTSYTETDPVFVASPSYTITDTNKTNWTTAYGWGNHASAGYATTAAVASGYQPLDGDLTSIAGLTGTTGILRKTAANTFTLDTATYLTSANIANLQPLDSDLTAISALPNSAGLIKKTSDGVYSLDTSVYLTSALIANLQPLDSDLTAISGLANATGLVKKTSDGVYTLDQNSYQIADSDLTAISALANSPGFVKKTSDGVYSLDNSTYLTTATAATTYQPLDGDLTSIAGLAGTTGYLKKTAANTFVLDTVGFQPLDADLTSIAALAGTTGILKKTAADTWALDTTSYQTASADLTAIDALAGTTGFLKKTATDTWALDTTSYQTLDSDLTAISALANGPGLIKKTSDGVYSLDNTTYLSTTVAASTYQGLDADLTAIAALAGTTGLLKKTAANTWALDTSAYLTTASRVNEAVELDNGSAVGGLLGAGGGGAGRIQINTLAQAGNIDIDVAPITAAGGALTYTNVANFNATSIIPGVTDTISLGTDAKRWSAIYVKEAGTATVPSVNLANGTVGGTGFYSDAAATTLNMTVNGVAEVGLTATNFYPAVNKGLALGRLAYRWDQLIMGEGSAALPAIVVGSDLLTTGLYSEALGTLSFTNTGVKTGAINSTGLTMVGKLEGSRAKVGLGTASVVGYALSGTTATNTGLYSATEGAVNVASLGNTVVSIDSSGNVTATGSIITPQVRATLGSATSVSYALSGTGSTGTGLYSSAEGTINFASAGVNIGNMTTGGNLTMNGIITAYSDSRLKEDLVPIISALDKVMTLTGYTYTKKATGVRETGLIAQDVKKVLPEAVVEDEYLSVAYGNMMGLIVEAIKELNTKIDKLGSK